MSFHDGALARLMFHVEHARVPRALGYSEQRTAGRDSGAAGIIWWAGELLFDEAEV